MISGNEVFITFQLRKGILIELHENHPSIFKMKALAFAYVWWSNIDNTIEMTVKSYKSCQINQTMTAKAPVHPWIKTCSSMGKIFLIIYNSYLKWPDAVPMSKITSF